MPNLMGVKFGGKFKIPTVNQSKSSSNSSNDNNNGAQSSKSLLERIKLRNQGIHVNNTKADSSPSDDTESSNDNEETETSLKKLDPSENPIDRSLKMTKMIQTYLTKKSKRFNRATTEQLVDYFNEKLHNTDTVKFKAVLKQICDFDKSCRIWSLKDEYLH